MKISIAALAVLKFPHPGSVLVTYLEFTRRCMTTSHVNHDTLVHGTERAAVAREGDTRAQSGISLRQIEGSSGSQSCSETAMPDSSQTVPASRDDRC